MIKRFFYRIFCGFFLGISIFAPGFSGSIIAIILGIYQDLLRIISNPFKKLKQNIRFCMPLFIGVAISAVLFVLTFNYLFDTYEKATYLLFVGLVAGNLPVIFAEVKKFGFKNRYLIGGIAAFAAALALGVLATKIEPVPGGGMLIVNLPVFALGGLAAGIIALVPGMSISIIMIIIGIYSQVIFMAESLLHMNTMYLLPFGLFCVCAVIGLVLASRGIKLIFEKYPGFANSTVLGFMTGSLISILIKSLQMSDVNFNWLLGGVMLAGGLGISMLFVVLGRKMKNEE